MQNYNKKTRYANKKGFFLQKISDRIRFQWTKPASDAELKDKGSRILSGKMNEAAGIHPILIDIQEPHAGYYPA